jgi:hypothetical protein
MMGGFHRVVWSYTEASTGVSFSGVCQSWSVRGCKLRAWSLCMVVFGETSMLGYISRQEHAFLCSTRRVMM